jgi:hypothetical protein
MYIHIKIWQPDFPNIGYHLSDYPLPVSIERLKHQLLCIAVEQSTKNA